MFTFFHSLQIIYNVNILNINLIKLKIEVYFCQIKKDAKLSEKISIELILLLTKKLNKDNNGAIAAGPNNLEPCKAAWFQAIPLSNSSFGIKLGNKDSEADVWAALAEPFINANIDKTNTRDGGTDHWGHEFSF